MRNFQGNFQNLKLLLYKHEHIGIYVNKRQLKISTIISTIVILYSNLLFLILAFETI